MDSTGAILSTRLNYRPVELQFGTSGRRGELVHLTQLEIYVNALAELRYLQGLRVEDGGIRVGEDFYFGYDLRPSSTQFVPESGGRGELCQAIVRAIVDAGMNPVNLGAVPTPALTFYALTRGSGSIMVTGSHIPFDRNGYKLNTSRGELLKKHEDPIGAMVAQVRKQLYAESADSSLFGSDGMLKAGHQELGAADPAGLQLYEKRYLDFFPAGFLAGKRLLLYQHSAVGRDLLLDLVKRLGAEAIPAGRSDTFVPIDTENIDDAQLALLQQLADDAIKANGTLDGVISTDGDSDRPLVLGVDSSGKLRFFGGDLIGMIVAEYLGADAVVVPISCNDAIDRGAMRLALQPKTKIGSPFVIAAMELAEEKGSKAVCGWEANGGFLLGSDVVRNGAALKKLATRDAMLPILGVLAAAAEQCRSLPELFDRLPQRFSRAALLKNFARAASLQILDLFGAANSSAARDLARFFPPALGFTPVSSIDYTDGVRVTFENGEVAHMRPSGNADEFRIYAVADTQTRANEIAELGVAEPNGVLRTLERSVTYKLQ